MLACPQCKGTAFEQRGDVRVYTSITVNDDRTLDEGTARVEWMTYEYDDDDDGERILYCDGCDSELTVDELVPE